MKIDGLIAAAHTPMNDDFSVNYERISAQAEHLAKRLTQLLEMADMPVTLKASGVEESMLTTLAAEAAGQWTASFNPREVGQAEMESIYRAAF